MRRRKAFAPSSVLDTLLIVEMWKGTVVPNSGTSTASCALSTASAHARVVRGYSLVE